MPEDLLTTFRALYGQSTVAFNEGDLDKALGGLADDFEWHAPEEDADHTVFRGPKEVKGWFAEMRDVFDDWRIELQDFEQLSDSTLLVHHVITGTSRGAGVPVEIHTYEVWEFEAMRPVRARQFLSREAAMAAAAMSEGNIERVRRATAAFNRGDLEAWAEHYDPDVVFEDLNHGPDQEPVTRGLPALRRIVDEWRQAMPDFRLDLEELVAVGDAVVAQVTYRGTGEGSQLAVDFPMVDVSWWDEDKVTYYLSGLESLEEGRRAVAEDRRLQTR